MFVVLVAILSFAMASLYQWLKGDRVDLVELLSGGEGFLVAVAITSDAVARAAKSARVHSFLTIGCVMVLLFALIGFAFTVSGRQEHKAQIAKLVNDFRRRAENAKIPNASAPGADDRMMLEFNRLLTEEEKQPFRPDRVASMSLLLVGLALGSSFLVIMSEEGE